VEIHTPEGSIHSLRQFFIHLLMIVLGILIALGIDQFKDYLHHRHIAYQARENLRMEIERNRKRLTDNLNNESKLRSVLQDLLANEPQVMREPEAAKRRIVAVEPSFAVLESTGWDTALATQAVAYMEYSEVEGYGNIYVGQRVFNDLENKFATVWLDLSTYGDNPQKLQPGEIKAALRDLKLALATATQMDGLGHSILSRYDGVLGKN